MKVNRVVVKYFSRHMLQTVDLAALFNTLFDIYGDNVTIEFVAMTEMERRASTDESALVPIVRNRFQIFETGVATAIQRRPDVEQALIAAEVK